MPPVVQNLPEHLTLVHLKLPFSNVSQMSVRPEAKRDGSKVYLSPSLKDCWMSSRHLGHTDQRFPCPGLTSRTSRANPALRGFFDRDHFEAILVAMLLARL
jgi:hypothetical protein